MKLFFEMELPRECSGCVFCQELCYCALMDGDPIGWDEAAKVDERAAICPFDNLASREKMTKKIAMLANDPSANPDVVFVLFVNWEADDPYYSDYQVIDSVFSSFEKAKERRRIVQREKRHEEGYKGTYLKVMKLDNLKLITEEQSDKNEKPIF